MKRQSLLLRSCAGPDAFATAIGTLAVGTVGAFDARLFWNLAQRQEEGMRGILGDEDFLRLIGEVPELVIPPPPPPPVVPATPRVADASPVVSVQTPPTSLWDL